MCQENGLPCWWYSWMVHMLHEATGKAWDFILGHIVSWVSLKLMLSCVWLKKLMTLQYLSPWVVWDLAILKWPILSWSGHTKKRKKGKQKKKFDSPLPSNPIPDLQHDLVRLYDMHCECHSLKLRSSSLNYCLLLDRGVPTEEWGIVTHKLIILPQCIY